MSLFWLVVINQLLSTSVLALVALGLGRIVKNATFLHLMWAAVFAKLLIPSPLVVPLPATERVPNYLVFEAQADTLVAPVIAEAITPSATPVTEGMIGVREVTTLGMPPITFQHVLVGLWIVGSSIIFVRGLIRFAGLNKLLRTESSLDQEANELANSIIEQSNLPVTKVPTVRLFGARISPMLFGVGNHSTIVCPTTLWNELTYDDRRAFLGHELAHYCRRDHWIRWLEWIATVVYWWFPLVYFARKQLERFEEIACDGWTVSNFSIGRKEYASALLSVVDFLNESRVGVPRLASRMQATQNLEERLRRLLAKEPPPQNRQRSLVMAGALLCLFPTFYLTRTPMVPQVDVAQRSAVDHPAHRQLELNSREVVQAVSLPESPSGWWNVVPTRRWADIKLKRQDLQLLADAGRGIRIVSPDHSYHEFESGYIRALAYIPSSSRFVIGNVDGELHLWDPELHRSVSLIGKHDSAVSSVSFHPQHGLATADTAGNIRLWDLGSGLIKSSIKLNRTAVALRWTNDGSKLYIVEGDWASGTGDCDLVVVSSNLSSETSRTELPRSVAVVQFDERTGPLALDWSGQVWSLITKDVVGFVGKEQVSGATLCENVLGVLIDGMFGQVVEE